MPFWLLIPVVRLVGQGVTGISRALESPQRREERLRAEEKEGRWKRSVGLIVAVLYSVWFWNLWLHFWGMNLAGLLVGSVIWLFSLMIVTAFAVALWPLTVAVLAIFLVLGISRAVIALSDYTHIRATRQNVDQYSPAAPKPELQRSTVKLLSEPVAQQSTIDPAACPVGTHHPAPEINAEQHRIEYQLVCATQFPIPASEGSNFLPDDCETGWEHESLGHGFDTCWKPLGGNGRTP